MCCKMSFLVTSPIRRPLTVSSARRMPMRRKTSTTVTMGMSAGSWNTLCNEGNRKGPRNKRRRRETTDMAEECVARKGIERFRVEIARETDE